MNVDTLEPPRAAVVLLAAGHGDAAAVVLIKAARGECSAVRLVTEGGTLRVRMYSAVPS